MKTLASIFLGLALAANAQAPGPNYSVVVTWAPYTNPAAAGFKIYVAPKGGTYDAPGSQTFVVTNVAATTFTFTVSLGEYKAAMSAFTAFGLESAKSPDINWSAPSSLPSPVGFEPKVIIYVP